MIPLKFRSQEVFVQVNGRTVRSLWHTETGELIEAEYVNSSKRPETLEEFFITRRNYHLKMDHGRALIPMKKAEQLAGKDIDKLLEKF